MKTLAVTAVAFACVAGCGQPSSSRPPPEDSEFKEIPVKMLPPKVKEEIAAYVRKAFYDKDRLMKIFCEDLYEPGELERSEVSAAIDLELAKWTEEKKSWPKVTDCDRLNTAFAAMDKRGVIALHNAGYTQSAGYDAFLDAYSQHPDKRSIFGYCFYNEQDLEGAQEGGGLYLAFGPVDPYGEESKWVDVGTIIREELERAGLKVDWDGTFNTRLRVPKLVWQRR